MSVKVKTQGGATKETATQKTLVVPCPYCSDLNIFEKAFATPIERSETAWLPRVRNIWRAAPDASNLIKLKEKEVIRGDYRIITVTGHDLAEQLDDFTIEILGVRFIEEPPFPPPDQFFKQGGEVHYDHHAKTEKQFWFLYNIYRVTHSKTDLVVDVHWWPEHGRIVTIQDFSAAGASATEIQVINETLKLFRIETRGGIKITEERIRQVLAGSGPNLMQKDAARWLDVTENGLEKWRARRGISTWQEVIERFS
jgi:hypothetical protein